MFFISSNNIDSIITYHGIIIKRKIDIAANNFPHCLWFQKILQISETEDFAQPKLVYNDIAQELSFALADDGIFLNNTAYFIGSKNVELLQYFQHILNSKLMGWYYRTISVQLGEKAVRMFSIYVLKIPIPFPERIVKEMSDIYYLYGLDDIEISYIESY